MFIRPMGPTVRPAQRPAGHPLLRGLLARAAGAVEDTTGAVGPGEAARWDLPARAVRAAEAPAEPPAETEEAPEPVEVSQGVAQGLAQGVAEEEEDILTASPTSPPTTPTPLVAELRQLADLTREGLLTPEEFTKAKARLLRG
ncbi:SHOCT domain-containing protein [Streptomyces sp. NRRL F-2580]|uniref:SHOCT domain-containing protein n=1 Tax=Streptomyces sp. NRRL F-2580 TaxID=1463841 RepID=UPI0004C4D6D3|nr:SHOCT domain-containing protein [Streptomyces sp. NRRL F-2580]